jgi:hypothetical protein
MSLNASIGGEDNTEEIFNATINCQKETKNEYKLQSAK